MPRWSESDFLRSIGLKYTAKFKCSLRMADRTIHHRLAPRFVGQNTEAKLRKVMSLIGQRYLLTDSVAADQFEVHEKCTLTADHVNEYCDANYLADPFVAYFRGVWHLYYEIYNSDSVPTAVIGHSTSHDGGSSWKFEGIALDPGWHISFPFVFEHADNLWMVPNLDPDNGGEKIRLYRSEEGYSFDEVAIIAEVEPTPTDRVVFKFEDRWWLIVAASGEDQEELVFFSESLTNESWTPHESNPVSIGKPRIPGGSPIVGNDSIIMFFQDGPHYYGESVEAFEIVELTPTKYEDQRLCQSSVIGPSKRKIGWNSGRMHTFEWEQAGDTVMYALDGDTDLGASIVGPNWSIRVYVGE